MGFLTRAPLSPGLHCPNETALNYTVNFRKENRIVIQMKMLNRNLCFIAWFLPRNGAFAALKRCKLTDMENRLNSIWPRFNHNPGEYSQTQWMTRLALWRMVALPLFFSPKVSHSSRIDWKWKSFRWIIYTQKTDTLQQNEYLIEVLRDVFGEIKLGETKTVLANALHVFQMREKIVHLHFLRRIGIISFLAFCSMGFSSDDRK